jgi:hypothetical protein
MNEKASQAAFERLLNEVREAQRRNSPEGRIEALDPSRLRIDPTREGEAAAVFDSYREQLVTAVPDATGFDRIWRKLEQEIRYGGFSTSKPEPLQQDVWRSELLRFGYGPVLEILFDDARGLVRPGQKIEHVDWWRIVVNGVSYTHEQVRLRGRPATSRDEAAWLAGFPPIPTRAEACGRPI